MESSSRWDSLSCLGSLMVSSALRPPGLSSRSTDTQGTFVGRSHWPWGGRGLVKWRAHPNTHRCLIEHQPGRVALDHSAPITAVHVGMTVLRATDLPGLVIAVADASLR
jgi:hypothetical protein